MLEAWTGPVTGRRGMKETESWRDKKGIERDRRKEQIKGVGENDRFFWGGKCGF